VTSTDPNPLIFVSNRNEPLPDGDTIAVYTSYASLPPSPDSDEFKQIASIPTGLKHVRSIALSPESKTGEPAGKYLVAGGAQGGGIKVFEVIRESKESIKLVQVAGIPEGVVESPTAFLWV
jgi:hypothetical protein